MHIKVVGYAPSTSVLVMAFADIVFDGWLRINGVNFLRDGSLKSPQLRYDRNGQRNWLSALAVPDPDLRELLAGDILAAINKYVATLPPEERMRPPRPPAAKPEKVAMPVTVAAPKKIVLPVKVMPKAVEPAVKTLPPPGRLLTGAAKGGRR
ncbi:MAG: hypothetical protein WBY44_27420 [Bryobacteraceae bacterium]